jgi:hypothetical protein
MLMLRLSGVTVKAKVKVKAVATRLFALRAVTMSLQDRRADRATDLLRVWP